MKVIKIKIIIVFITVLTSGWMLAQLCISYPDNTLFGLSVIALVAVGFLSWTLVELLDYKEL